MKKIATPQDLQAELSSLVASIQNSEKPARALIASKLRELADRLAADPGYSGKWTEIELGGKKYRYQAPTNPVFHPTQQNFLIEYYNDRVGKWRKLVNLSSRDKVVEKAKKGKRHTAAGEPFSVALMNDGTVELMLHKDLGEAKRYIDNLQATHSAKKTTGGKLNTSPEDALNEYVQRWGARKGKVIRNGRPVFILGASTKTAMDPDEEKLYDALWMYASNDGDNYRKRDAKAAVTKAWMDWQKDTSRANRETYRSIQRKLIADLAKRWASGGV